jgi:Flp pilus assembly protein TadD
MQIVSRAISAGDLQTAISSLERAAKVAPREPGIYITLGLVFQMAGRAAEADKAFTLGLELSPNDPTGLFGLGATKAEAGQPEEAEPYLRRAVETDPSNTQAHLVLARTLSDLNRFEEAEAELKLAIAAHPDEPSPYAAYGIRLQEVGRFQEAESNFRVALELDQNHCFAYLGLIQSRRMTEEDRGLMDAMLALLSAKTLSDDDRIDLLSGLGKASNDLREYERAIEYFSEANRLSDAAIARSTEFEESKYVQHLEASRNVFTKDFLEGNLKPNDFSPRPIFIVGMMRSGTTLVEQILSSHPSVAPGGEMVFWTRHSSRCLDQVLQTFNIHKALGGRKKYNKLLRTFSDSASFITDKMPDNYRVLGTLRLMYPEAKIIHCKRNPVDTCLSIFMTPFRKPPEYSRDPKKLVFVYRQYLALMDHWRSVLPKTTLLEVSYEDLVLEREQTTKRILEFCGLKWHDGCLHPEDNLRPVVTASAWQARQPVYRTSLERWRNYEPWLGEFAKLLDT